MDTTIVIAGATGNLGGRIVRELRKRNATVLAVVRPSAGKDKIAALEQAGATVKPVDMSDVKQLTAALRGAACVVSALAGLDEVIINAQYVLLQAAVAAGVPRFIPSDYCVDFTRLPPGENRNFDLRRDFRHLLDVAKIKATSIFNGAFAEMLQHNMPFLNQKDHTVGYIGNPDRLVDFTTMDNAAAYTAAAALDDSAPRNLCISSFQVSANGMAAVAGEVLGADFRPVSLGTIQEWSERNKADRAADPEGENQLYPKWQNGQYLQSMFTVYSEQTDNSRYEIVVWTKAKEFLATMKK